ncbi:sigma-70 family RNA polymerase sigma factor [Streptomyces sp. CA-250714]|uniref:sigma-70 family RNA polymerase sigma factor n=1 Tax=Streptomyces sp. CA-250714 TaxID=3240060 RepID=UPI003D91445B
MELLSRMREGDDGAYEELYRRHAEPVRRYARTCCRDADTAEDLTGEVFARTLQAVRGGKGPEASVRAYLLASVRHVAAHWARTRRRERLVDDFAAFAQSAAASAACDEDTLELGAEVRAMREAEQRLVVRAFRSLSEYDRMLLWHTAVEGVPPQEVAPLLGKSRGATATAAHRAREHLKQAYLQAHVNQALTEGGECARYADRLGAYARGGLRMRAERGLARHLEECPACRQAASEVKDLNEHIRLLVPLALVGWFGTASGAKAFAALIGGGATTAAAGGAAAGGAGAGSAGGAAAGGAGGATGGAAAGGAGSGSAGAGASGGAGSGSAGAGAGGAASEGLGAPAKAGIGLGVAAAAGAVIAYALSGGDGEPAKKPEARHPAPPSTPGQPPTKPDPAPRPEPRPEEPEPAPEQPDPAPPQAEPGSAPEPEPADAAEPPPRPEPPRPEPPAPRPLPPPPSPSPEPPPPSSPSPPRAERHLVEVTRDTVMLSSNTGDRDVRLVVERHPSSAGGASSVEMSAANWAHSSSRRSTASTAVSDGRPAGPASAPSTPSVSAPSTPSAAE